MHKQTGSSLLSTVLFFKGFLFLWLVEFTTTSYRAIFINLNICGWFGGNIGEFGRNRPENKTLLPSKVAAKRTFLSIPLTHPHFIVSRVWNDHFISYYSNESEYYSTLALILLLQQVLLNFAMYCGYCGQRNERAYTVCALYI
jgi:hypothetical protein